MDCVIAFTFSLVPNTTSGEALSVEIVRKWSTKGEVSVPQEDKACLWGKGAESFCQEYSHFPGNGSKQSSAAPDFETRSAHI